MTYSLIVLKPYSLIVGWGFYPNISTQSDDWERYRNALRLRGMTEGETLNITSPRIYYGGFYKNLKLILCHAETRVL